MNKRLMTALCFFCALTFWMISCSKSENDWNVSEHHDDNSHNSGQNCMNCHYQEGPGEGWFSLAGSVSRDDQNDSILSIRVFDALSQDLLTTVEVDRLGNFYTTASINFINGTTIDIIDGQGQVVKAMGTVVKNGQCNLCHNNSFQDEIIIP
jgi:hypothetical protein